MAVTAILPDEEAKKLPEKGEDTEAKTDPA
jgi:hypothetical protein